MMTAKYTDSALSECEQLCAITAKSIITAKRNKNHCNKTVTKKATLSNEDCISK